MKHAMPAVVETAVDFYLQCVRCGRVETKRYRVATGGTMPFLALPEGWQVLKGMLVCPAHQVTFTIDGAS